MAAPSKAQSKKTYFKLIHSALIDPALPIHISGFLDLFGVSMILPLILSHSRDLGTSPTVTGILEKIRLDVSSESSARPRIHKKNQALFSSKDRGSSYGALQLFSSPVIGQWSDVAGRRFTLLVCLFMSGLGYSIFTMATTVTVMFVARIPLGIFKHSQNIGKSYLSDVSSGIHYSTVLGHFNSVSSIGFILGPAVGGHIAERPGGFYTVAAIAGTIFFINFGIIWWFIPKDKEPQQHNSVPRNYSSSISLKKMGSDEINFNPKNFYRIFSKIEWTDIWDLFLIKFLLGISIIIFRSNFSLMLIEKFDTTPRINGYIISFNSTVSALVGFFAGYIARLYNNNAKLLFHLSCLLGLTLFSLSLSPSLLLFVTLLIPLGLITTVARICGTTLTIERTKGHDIGTLMGFQQSCMSVARMLAPLIAGLVQEICVLGPGFVGTFTTLLAVIIFIVRPQDAAIRVKKQN